MSWWAQKIASSLRLDDEEDESDKDDEKLQNINADDNQQHNQQPDQERGGVKEDLSELTKTLTRQFWGVASFLAPPPSQISGAVETSDPEPSDASGISGIRSDFAEIGGRFRSGISKLSSNIAASDFSKIASNFLQLGSEEEDYGSVAGVTAEVVAFARDMAMHPETWLDFPLPDNNDDADEFDMSDTQQAHALAVEHLAPRLAALRLELCPTYMSEGCFWMIYFVLLHPRLNKHDAELLSTPEIVKARAILTRDSQKRALTNPEQNQPVRDAPYISGTSIIPSESIPIETVPVDTGSPTLSKNLERDKHPILSSEVPIVDKSVIEEGPVNRPKEQKFPSGSTPKMEEKFEDDGDDWLKEESSDVGGGAGTLSVPIGNEEDVSFSDLEEDEVDDSSRYKKVTYGSDSSTRESREWVQLGRSSTDSTKDVNTVGPEQVSAPNSDTKESSDWLDLEEIDVE